MATHRSMAAASFVARLRELGRRSHSSSDPEQKVSTYQKTGKAHRRLPKPRQGSPAKKPI